MKKTATLSELKDHAEKAGSGGKLLFSQTEEYPGGLTLSDEDVQAGAALKMKVQFLLMAPDGQFYYEDRFEQVELFKEAQREIKELKELVPAEQVEASELEKEMD